MVSIDVEGKTHMLYDFAFSKQGHNHIKVDKVCEDASGHYSDDIMSIAVVADGHGSDNYPRTERGSYFAVKAAIHSIKEFVHTVEHDAIDIAASSEAHLEQLAKNILAHWYGSVEHDVAQSPFTTEELAKIAEKYKRRYLSGERTEKAYGTTLIAVCETADYWFGIQIGDGKCVCIMPDGSAQEPIPWDDDCQSNVTTSICDSEAIDEFRYCFLEKDRKPIATFVGTDGIDDSYANSEELHSLYRSIWTIFVEHGSDVGAKEVEDFLPGLSRKGSGDDVSIAGIITASISPTFLSLLKAQCEYAKAKDAQQRLEREVVLAAETREYVISAMQKAKASYELAAQKVDDADAAVSSAQKAHSDALMRFEQATLDLNLAMNAYSLDSSSIVPTKCEEEDGNVSSVENESDCEASSEEHDDPAATPSTEEVLDQKENDEIDSQVLSNVESNEDCIQASDEIIVEPDGIKKEHGEGE